MTIQYAKKRGSYALPVYHVKNKARERLFVVGNKIRPISTYYSIQQNLYVLRSNRYPENSEYLNLKVHYQNLAKMLLSIDICVEE